MNKTNWVVLLVSAMTDFIITAATALTSAMVAKGDAMLPEYPVVVLAMLGGIVAFSRTIQQALRAKQEQE